jgi:hypothetical protein
MKMKGALGVYLYFNLTAAQNTRRCEGRRVASGSDWRLLFRPLTVSGFLLLSTSSALPSICVDAWPRPSPRTHVIHIMCGQSLFFPPPAYSAAGITQTSQTRQEYETPNPYKASTENMSL